MSEYQEEDMEESESSVVSQLGSSTRKLADGDIDMRLLTIIRDPTEVPTSLRPLLYILTRADVTVRRKPFWDSLADNALHLFVGVDGRGRNDLLRAEQAKQGQSVSVESEVQKARPGFVGQYITNRNWEEEERKKLGLE